MTYQEALEYIHSRPRMGKKSGTHRMDRLMELLGHPYRGTNFVHIAGTNGKGSTTAMLASVLREAGYRTGMFISPYIIEYRERIQIDGEMIPREALARLTAQVKEAADQMDQEGEGPSEFEIGTAIAFLWYREQRCEIVMLEVGLGGRLDPTNAIERPLLSVITSIGLDHTNILGETVAEIAFEKCGIIKPHGITVCYPDQDPEALAVIMESAAHRGNRLVMGMPGAAEVLSQDFGGTDFCYGGLRIHLPLIGAHQLYNCITVIESALQLRGLGFGISDRAIVGGIAAVRFPARMELLAHRPDVVVDGAHNPSGARAFRDALALAGDRRVAGIVGMLADKDCRSSLRLMTERMGKVIAVTPDCYRALPAGELAGMIREFHPDVISCDDYHEALRLAREYCGPEGLVAVCGSLYLASDLRRILVEERERPTLGAGSAAQ